MSKRAIWKPTTITESGYYFLSEDIIGPDLPTEPCIMIQARYVTLDLNGLTIDWQDAEPGTISIGENTEKVIIQNGKINGPTCCAIGTGSGAPRSVRIESIILNGCGEGFHIDAAEEIEILDCSFEYGGFVTPLRLNTEGKKFRGRILNNRITNVSLSYTIVANGMQNGEISGNILEKYGHPGSSDIGAGLLLTGKSSGNVIRQNIFNCGKGKSAGIEIHGAKNLIEDNQITRNSGPGIFFTKESKDNAYRMNMLRGNTEGPVIDFGTNNTDSGGNII